MRSVTGKPLRVDANEGWKDKETAIRKIEWLATQGVELIEQPMPAAMLEEQRWVRGRSPLPIFADEACLRAADIPGLADAYHGVDVKLDKAGGLREALRMIHIARACGLKVMLGCMISSSVSTTAAAHLSPLVRLRRPRRQPADRERPVGGRARARRASRAARPAGPRPRAPPASCTRQDRSEGEV